MGAARRSFAGGFARARARLFLFPGFSFFSSLPIAPPHPPSKSGKAAISDRHAGIHAPDRNNHLLPEGVAGNIRPAPHRVLWEPTPTLSPTGTLPGTTRPAPHRVLWESHPQDTFETLYVFVVGQ
jgi:hypothetical protein